MIMSIKIGVKKWCYILGLICQLKEILQYRKIDQYFELYQGWACLLYNPFVSTWAFS
jgi:hypothetical protein